MFGGTCTIFDGVSTTFGDAHTPPLGKDIIIGAADHAWLTILGQKFQANEKRARRELRALEYFHRAWPTDQSERFPILCMALDAVFGDANQATRAVIEGVRTTLGEHVSEPRLRLLMELRGAVIHGGAPDVYDSRKYGRYYDEFGHDPIVDLELVVAACLRKRVFGAALVEHADPDEHMIAEMQAKGRLPRQLTGETILDLQQTRCTGRYPALWGVDPASAERDQKRLPTGRKFDSCRIRYGFYQLSAGPNSVLLDSFDRSCDCGSRTHWHRQHESLMFENVAPPIRHSLHNEGLKRAATLFDRAIDNQVSRLRRKIERDAASLELVATVRGGGYCFMADVTENA